MRLLAIACAGVCTLVSIPGFADPSGDELRARGEQLAKDGRYTEAIAAFKAANKLTPRATNFCLIGLAYTRREMWPQAEIVIDRCKQLATADDPLPDWLPALEEALASGIARLEVAPIEIQTEPADASVELSVSSFAPDEQFHPRTIHLPLGTHLIVATAPGYLRTEQPVEVTDKHAQRIVIKLRRAQPAASPVAPRPSPPPPPPASKLPLVVMATGAGLLAVGAVYHATVFRTAADKLADATGATPDPAEYDAWSHRFDVRRTTVLALYGAGAVTFGVGLVLKLVEKQPSEHDVHVAVTPMAGGGVLTLGWVR